jgi:asparagine synthase (glutamine-hydrolysing)
MLESVGHKECVSYANIIASYVAGIAGQCSCAILSGGIDTTFIVLVHPRRSQLRVVTVDLGGDDLVYASLVTSKLGIRSHTVLRPTEEELLEAVDWVLGNLKTIDPIEVSADAIHYLTSKWALRSGCDCLLSGDGGDEVLLGYTFLEGKSLEEIVAWHRSMLVSAWLPTVHVGALVGVRVLAPLYSQPVRDIAGSLPLNCMILRGVGGKILLRLYIESQGLWEVAWRRKTPVSTGSGSLEALKRIAGRVQLGEGALEDVNRIMGFNPPTPLHRFLAYRMVELGVEPPGVVEDGCPLCGRALHRSSCRFCGSYVTPQGYILHYSGD